MSYLIVVDNPFYNQPESIETLTSYITNPIKTRADLIAAQGLLFCDTEYAIQQFEGTMYYYGNHNRFMHHFIVSFDTQGAEGYIKPNAALQIVSYAFQSCFPGQMLSACHVDTEHIHVHVICSNVDIYGNCFSDKRNMYNEIADAIQFQQEKHRRAIGVIKENPIGQENEELEELYTDRPRCAVLYRNYNKTEELIESSLQNETLI